jgi:hypothetical protein
MNKKAFSWISVISVFLFIILLFLLHFLEPEFNPVKNLISEYELGKYGWVMSLAFMSMGFAIFTMLYSSSISPINKKYQFGKWWLIIIGIAYFGAGIFYPYVPTNTASMLHGIFGIIIIATSPIAYSIYSSGLLQSNEYKDENKRIIFSVLLAWFGLITFMGSTMILGVVMQPVDRTTAYLPIGWQNRFMIVTYGIWIIIANLRLLKK